MIKINAMEIIHSTESLENKLSVLKQNGKTIGFVPTMGALHKGHISLVKKSKESDCVTVVSIFVNPTQFNDPEDFKNYPLLVDEDINKLKEVMNEKDILFIPSVKDMYPTEESKSLDIDLRGLDSYMEGKYRQGHFNGVVTVVNRFFEMVKPHKAYFGLKDFQQLAIINQLVKERNIPIEIVPCEIVRESDGLAMSSRNMLLLPEKRKASVTISQALFESQKMASSKSISEIKEFVIQQINSNEHLEVEYFEIADYYSLKPLNDWSEAESYRGCVAVKAGNVRLIDNVGFRE